MRYLIKKGRLIQTQYNSQLAQVQSETTRAFMHTAVFLLVLFVGMHTYIFAAQAISYIAPEKTVTIGATLVNDTTIAITLENNQTLLNAAEIEMFLDPAHIDVTDITITDNLCMKSFLITKEIDNQKGRIFYQCGTYIPFMKASTTLAIIQISSLRVGTSTITFGAQTNVLAHDGYGSNVTKERISSSIVTNS